jgi:hypothetical protein
MFYSLIDRTDTTSFTGCIIIYRPLSLHFTYWGLRNQDNHQRAHFMRRRGLFRMILSSASALWTLPTQTWYFYGIPNTPVRYLTAFFFHLLRNLFHPHRNCVNTSSDRPPLFLPSFSNWERYFLDIGGSVEADDGVVRGISYSCPVRPR